MSTAADPYGLSRFVAAQDPVWRAVREELAAGLKQSHWMWFVFPQIAGLGSSPMARRYAVSGLAEARAYLAHPVLGPRLAQAVALMMPHAGRPLGAILGTPDDLKFRSAMTLFARAAGPGADAPFRAALDAFCGGQPDGRTLALLAGQGGGGGP